MTRRMIVAILLVLMLLVPAYVSAFQLNGASLNGVETIEDLDTLASFSFAIMSDNKGESPVSSAAFGRMVRWIETSNDRFVIGLGDHVKRGYGNTFLDFLDDNEWWRANFYPNVADGENEYYGSGQDDWGAGAPILDTVALTDNPCVTVSENGCEYYARIPVDDYTIHLIQLHYSDSPEDPAIAFNANSHKYLIDTLESIDKTDKDIIIAAAHSRYGFWIDQLTEDEQELVVTKCDLVLSATSHFFERLDVNGYDANEALVINTGSISYPFAYCPPGYVQVHFIENPNALVVQYINCDYEERELEWSDYAYIKLLDGPVIGTSFRNVRYEENHAKLLGYINRNYSIDEMTNELKTIYVGVTGADVAYISANAGISEGDLFEMDLWSISPYNNEIYALTLTAEQIETVFEGAIEVTGKSEVKIATNSWLGGQIIEELGLPDDKVAKSGVKEIDALTDWVDLVSERK